MATKTIYTLGTEKLRLSTLQAFVSMQKIDRILDWRETPEKRMPQDALERAFPNRYAFVGDKCNADHITSAALTRLTQLNGQTLLLFGPKIPAACERHEKLALPLARGGKVAVYHVFENQLIEAVEYQRSIDDDNDYECDEWQPDTPAAPIAPAAIKQMAPVATIGDVTDRALLVKLSVRMFGTHREDKQVNAEVARTHGSDPAMTKVTKQIMASEAFAHLRAIESEVRNEFYTRTVPWYDGGLRAIASPAYMDFAQLIRETKLRWNIAVGDILDNWDVLVEDAKKKLNGLANDVVWPSQNDARRTFSLECNAMPMPKIDDWRGGLSKDEIAVLKQQYEEQLNQAAAVSMQDIFDRLRKPITAMRDALSDADKTFRDTLVTNISDLLAIIPALNLTGNPQVNQFCDEIQQVLASQDPDTLRKNKRVRKDTARRADEILAKMAAFVA